MAERISQEVVEAEVVATPAARVSQEVVEAEVVATPEARVSQEVVEAEVVATPHLKISQEVIEAEVVATPLLRLSQMVLEILVPNIEVFMPIVYPDLPGLGYSVHWKPKAWNMPTAVMDNGARLDLGFSDGPLHDFELTYNFLRGQGFQRGSTEFRKFMGFFLNLNGNLGRFLFPNPDDRSVTNQFVATTDGINHTWVLPRTFGVDEYVGTEPVGYVDLTLPFNAYFDGVLIPPSSYNVLQTEPVNQQIDFIATPTTGQNLTVDMSYFYYCNFPEDTLDFEKFMNSLWMLKSVKFSSNRAGT